MNEVMGIVTNTKGEEILEDIAMKRCVSAVPFGGRYRLIDFTLSNMVNSGISNVAIVISDKFRALLDHIGSGKEWSLDRKKDGLVFIPEAKSDEEKFWGISFKDLYHNVDYLRRSNQRYVVISGSSMVCNIDYNQVLNFHKEKEAEVTVIYKEEKLLENNQVTWLISDLDNRVVEINKEGKPADSNKASMEMCIIERELLINIIEECSENGIWNAGDFFRQDIAKYKVFGFEFTGFLGRIDSVKSYYKHNLDVLDPEVWQELFFAFGPIYTKTKDGPPARYLETAEVKNTLVSSGSTIAGELENCIVFRRVEIGKGSKLKNCIIMQKTKIAEDVYLENIILDKDVTIRKGTHLKGAKENPMIITKKSVI